jgi:two-component system alkaline phosphatase synthesis response regulator PhoP
MSKDIRLGPSGRFLGLREPARALTPANSNGDFKKEKTMKQRIMLVDDDPDIVEMLGGLLEGEKYEVLYAYGGEECLEKLSSEEGGVDLLVLDLMLPDIDGYEVCRHLRLDPRFTSLSIIMLTARRDTVEKIAGLKVGADDYLTKPFDAHELLARIRAQLRIKKLQEKVIEAEKTATIANMAITLSGEINDPLASIVRHAQSLQERLEGNRDIPQDILISLEAIGEATHRIEGIVERLRGLN